MNKSFALAVTEFYENELQSNFVWKFDKKCDKDIVIEYPNILIKSCLFSYINEKKSVRWCSPINVEADTNVEFVISFDKLLHTDEYEYNFKKLISGTSTTLDIDNGVVMLYSADGSTIYSTNDSTNPLVVTLVDRYGWFDLKFAFTIDEKCNIDGFDYFADLKGHISSFKKNRCHDHYNTKQCHHSSRSSHHKIKIDYTSYITLVKNQGNQGNGN
jgi:hypothetical protein